MKIRSFTPEDYETISRIENSVYPDYPDQKQKVDALPGTKDELTSIVRDENFPNEKGILSGKIEERLVAIKLLVAEDTERGVARAVALDDRCGALTEDLPFLLDAFALGEQ